MKTSSCLGGRIKAIKWLILVIWAVFRNFFEEGKSGRFTGFSESDSEKRGLIRALIGRGGDDVVGFGGSEKTQILLYRKKTVSSIVSILISFCFIGKYRWILVIYSQLEKRSSHSF
jgi:hypothetical protein